MGKRSKPPLTVHNLNPLRLECARAPAGSMNSLALEHGGHTLAAHDDAVESVVGGDEPLLIEVADFRDGELEYRVSVFTIEEGGALSPWTRAHGKCVSPAELMPPGLDRTVKFVVVAVSTDGEHSLFNGYPQVRCVGAMDPT
ncbi:hypothetical protein [Haliangium sp.]|uniref:hypothetical protein n=1 Tax=Haliangium sp. TaxID=2663208 RepID=UPI003D135B5B